MIDGRKKGMQKSYHISVSCIIKLEYYLNYQHFQNKLDKRSEKSGTVKIRTLLKEISEEHWDSHTIFTGWQL
jgi:hypothetical protein